MLFLLGCETSTLIAAGAGTAKWIYLLFQSLPFPTGSLCWISKSTDQLMKSERHLQKWQKNISWCRNQSSVGRLGRKFSLCLHLNWSLAALQGLSCWAGDLLELPRSLHMWDYQWKQIAEVGQATAISALGQDTARELRTPARAGVSHYSSERSTRLSYEIMQLKIEAVKLQVGNRGYICVEGICIVVGFISFLIYWPTVSAKIL